MVNDTNRETPHTRIIEHKHFEFGAQPKIVVTREYPAAWEPGGRALLRRQRCGQRPQQYAEKAAEDKMVLFGGRLGEYQCYDMDKVIASALAFATQELG
ncbi:MAG: hypothetical protein LUC47_00275 [Clostridiales bacterium]|nr:hypothetical protein [Clostridiales bacterium]